MSASHPVAVHANGKLAAAATGRSARAEYLLLTLASIAFLYYARAVMLPLFLAAVLSMALRPGVKWGRRRRVPAALAAALLVAIVMGVGGGIVYGIGRPAAQWARNAPQTVAQVRSKIENALPFHRPPPAPPAPGARPDPAPPSMPLPNFQITSAILSWTGSTLAGVASTIIVLYLLLASGDWFWTKLAALLAPHYEEAQVMESCDRLQHEISRYLFSITLINAVFGFLMALGLAAIGLPNPAMWGVLAAVLNFIPYFGPCVGMCVAGVVGILTFSSPLHEFLPLILYLSLHILEADLITPSILGKRFTIHPLIVFVSLLFWTWLWGASGTFLAAPILVALKVACERSPRMSALGELLDR